MRTPLRKYLAVAAVGFLCAAGADGQDSGPGVRSSIAIGAGYARAQGEWTRHPYAPV